MPYGLHMRLDVPERQACDLRASQGVQGNAIITALVGINWLMVSRSGCLQGTSLRLLRGFSPKYVRRPM